MRPLAVFFSRPCPRPTCFHGKGSRMTAKNGRRLGFLPDWRVFTYIILGINVLFVLWLVTGINSVAHGTCSGLDAQMCSGAKAVGGTIGAGIIVVLWFLVDVILGVLFLVTNRGRKRDCPACGQGVKRGVRVCRSCRYDFAYAPQSRADDET